MQQQPTRKLAGPGQCFLLGFAPDGGYLSRRVTATLVRSYIKPLRAAPFHQFGSRWSVIGCRLNGTYDFPRFTDYRSLTTDYRCIVSVALSRLDGFLRQGSPLTTVLPCGVQTFLSGFSNQPERPSSLLFTLSIIFENWRHQNLTE